MNNQIRYIFILFCLCLTTYGLSQSGSNPFEIIRSEEDINVTQDIDTSRSSTDNAFEVYRNNDNIAQEHVDTITKDDVYEIATKTDSSLTTSTEEATKTAPIVDYTSDNPFEVSHIPYRRSELKKQANSNSEAAVVVKKNKPHSSAPISTKSNTFIFWLVLFTLLLLAIVVNVQRNTISKLVRSISNENVLKLSKREENGGLTGHYIMMYVVFFINIACFVYLVLKRYYGFDGFRNWLLIFGGIVVLYLTRHVSMSILGKIFNITKESSLYSFTIMSFNLFLGLVLIPINLVFAFSPPEISNITMYTGIIVILILLFIRLLRGLLIGMRFMSDHLFQFFIYLCAFEIAPVLILLRILSN